jgi:protein tyrosine phosphatase (PTP) superfamily phosphohydrolase (DUF442 family)
MTKVADIYNFQELSKSIGTSGQPTIEQFTLISEAGYEVVINLALTDTDYALEDEAGVVQDLGMKYIHIPVIWENPTPADFEQFVGVMQELQGKKLFVHCVANMRVSVFMALYRMHQLGWELDRAMQDVYRIWQPNEIWDAFIHQVLKG